MTAIVRDGQHGLTMVQAQAQALDVALRAAGALKNARGLLPEALKSEGEIVAVLLAGQELGLPPMAALRGLQVVRGKVIVSYDTMIALLRRAGYRIEWLVSTATEARLRLTAPDGTQHIETWTQERAKKAGLWGSGTWGKYPDTMLRARCVSSAARAFAGEVLAGVYLEESGEREEIEQPMRGVSRATHGYRTPDPRDEVIDAEASCGAPEPEPTPAVEAPAQLSQCTDAAQLAAWIAANASKPAARRRPDDVRGKVREHATRIAGSLGLAPEDVEAFVADTMQALEAALAD